MARGIGYHKEKGFLESKHAFFVENMEHFVSLEEIKLLKDELDVDSGKNLKGVNEHYMDENLLEKNLP